MSLAGVLLPPKVGTEARLGKLQLGACRIGYIHILSDSVFYKIYS